jgi:hypothetical protein
MAAAGDEASRVDARLDALIARLEKLEAAADRPAPPQKKTGWEIYKLISPLLQGLILAILAYILTGRVTNAIDREQLNLSGVNDIRELLVRLQGSKPEEGPDRQAAAVTLAAYGRFAVAPLIHALDTAQREGRLDTAQATERALAMNGWSDPAPVCAALGRVISDPARSFHAETHRSAINVLARAHCVDQLPAVKTFAAQLAGGTPAAALPRLQQIVDPDTPANSTNVEKLRSDLTRTISILECKDPP